MGWRNVQRCAHATIVAVALFATGCAQSNELSGDAIVGAPTSVVAASAALASTPGTGSRGPAWYLAGMAEAGRERAASIALTRPNFGGRNAKSGGGEGDATGLPSMKDFVAALAQAGIAESNASCLYEAIAAGGADGSNAKILQLLVAQDGEAVDPDAVTAVQSIDQDSIPRFIGTVLPCVDTSTLFSLIAAVGLSSVGGSLGGAGGLSSVGGSLGGAGGLSSVGGSLGGALSSAGGSLGGALSSAGGSLGGAGTLAALLGAAGSVNLGGVTSASITALVAAAGGNLDSSQLASIAALLIGALGGQKLSSLDTADISNLDLSKLDDSQATLLVALIIKGLTDSQQSQFSKLAGVNIASLGLKIDPSKVRPDQQGALLVLLLPFLANGINLLPGAIAPAGADPTQIYIPEGLDLSQINPLLFVSKANFTNALNVSGITTEFGACVYDQVKLLDPRALGLILAGLAPEGVAQLILAIIACEAGHG